jgi:hypothetical protein
MYDSIKRNCFGNLIGNQLPATSAACSTFNYKVSTFYDESRGAINHICEDRSDYVDYDKYRKFIMSKRKRNTVIHDTDISCVVFIFPIYHTSSIIIRII